VKFVMNPVVAILAAGNMGAAVAGRLTSNGISVRTCLEGRSAATLERAKAAGLSDVARAELVQADIFLSILPPGEAVATAQSLLPHLSHRKAGFIYVDCNAVSPQTVRQIAAIVGQAGCPFIDAAIIGPPPQPGKNNTVFYASGADCAPLVRLADFGLDIRPLGPEIGAASALKMSYAGITKGLTGLAAGMMLAATREGAAAALFTELQRSQPGLLAWFEHQVPTMVPKAYRWVAEMEEISAFLGEKDAASTILEGMARLYERIAADDAGDKAESRALSAFLAQGK